MERRAGTRNRERLPERSLAGGAGRAMGRCASQHVESAAAQRHIPATGPCVEKGEWPGGGGRTAGAGGPGATGVFQAVTVKRQFGSVLQGVAVQGRARQGKDS